MKFLDKNSTQKIVLALGFFDCVHVAHRKILNQTIEDAKKYSANSCVLTFLNNVKNTEQIYNFTDRVNLLDVTGVDYVLCFEFTPEFSNVSAIDFLNNLIDSYNVVGFTCGYDYRFGKNAEGDVNLLSAFCHDCGINLYVLDKQTLGEATISSSYIKNLLRNGDIESANILLEVPYHITGKVVRGRGEGHLFGFPTANLEIKSDKILPKMGVYGTMCDINGKKFKSVTNVGIKPTFKDSTISIESYIQDFDGNIYDKEITVNFYKYLRDTAKFDSTEALRDQIYNDMRW